MRGRTAMIDGGSWFYEPFQLAAEHEMQALGHGAPRWSVPASLAAAAAKSISASKLPSSLKNATSGGLSDMPKRMREVRSAAAAMPTSGDAMFSHPVL